MSLLHCMEICLHNISTDLLGNSYSLPVKIQSMITGGILTGKLQVFGMNC